MYYVQISFRLVQTLTRDDLWAKLYSDDYQGIPIPRALCRVDGYSYRNLVTKPWAQMTTVERKDLMRSAGDLALETFAPNFSLSHIDRDSVSDTGRPPWRPVPNGLSRQVYFDPAGTPNPRTYDLASFDLDGADGVKTFNVEERYWLETTID
ncbi:MAG: hypothetical protein R3F34_05180 [Planctomycetota bacterium]